MLVFFTSSVFATDRYWVGGGGNWSDDTNHWATSSGGAPGAGNKPGSGDAAIFDGSSGGGMCTLDQTVSIAAFNMALGNTTAVDTSASNNYAITTSGDFTITAGTFTANGSTLTVGGNWDSSAAGATFAFGTSMLKMTGTSKTLKPAGGWLTRLYNLTIDTGASVTHIGGVFEIANNIDIKDNASLTLNTHTFQSSGNATGILTIGSGATLSINTMFYHYISDSSSHISSSGMIARKSGAPAGWFIYVAKSGSTAAPLTARTYDCDVAVTGEGGAVAALGGGASLNLGSNNLYIWDKGQDAGDYGILDNPSSIPIVSTGTLEIADQWDAAAFTGKLIAHSANYQFGSVVVRNAGQLDCATGSGASTWTVSGNVTTKNGSTFSAGGSTWNVSGNWDSSSGTFNYGTSTVNLTGSGTLKVNTGGYFYNLSMATNAKTTTLQSNINVANVCTLGAGMLTGSYTIFLTASSGKPLVNNSATISINRVRYEPTGSGTITVDGGNYGTATNMTFYRAGVQSTTFNLEDDLTIAGTLYIVVTNLNGSLIFNTQGNALNAAALQLAKEDSGAGPTVNFGASTVNLGTGGLAVSNWDYGSVHTLNLGSSTVNCAGPWKLIDGPDRITQNPGTSTVNFNGANQSISGSGTFYNLTKTVTTAATLTFQNSKEQIITNALTLQGASGQLLSLRSDSANTQYKITLQAGKSQTLSYIDVQDSDASGGQTLAAGPYSTNSGGNSNWTFKIISVVLRDAGDTADYTTWNIGTGKTTDTTYIMNAGNAVLVKNNGNVSEDFSIQATGTNWTLGGATGVDTCVLMGLFNGNTDPVEGDYNVTYDVITGTTTWAAQLSGNGKFEGTNDGDAVSAGAGEKLYIYLKTPSSLTNGNQETITVTIGAREH